MCGTHCCRSLDGRLTDGQGHVVDFRNTVVIMTSNIGTKYAKRGGTMGFRKGDTTPDEMRFEEEVNEGLKRTFRPEFLNRIDEIIIFHNLTKEHVKQIVDLQMAEIEERLEDQGLSVELTDAARNWLAEEGYDPQFGARPLRRTLQKHVESPLSKQVLGGQFHAGDVVVVNVADGQLTFARKGGYPVDEEFFTRKEAAVSE